MSARAARHQHTERPPLGGALLVLSVAVVLSGGACLWAILTAPEEDRRIIAWSAGGAAVLLCVAMTVATYYWQAARHYRSRIDAMDGEFRDHVAAMNRNFRDHVAAMNAEASRIADETLPSLVRSLRDGSAIDAALAEVDEPGDPAHQRMLRTFAKEIGRGERMRAAAMSACANAAGRVQALATTMLADLREMEERHDEKVLGDLLRLDHATAQAGRLADSIAVLTGARSGRRWTKPIVMESVLRGAVGRISAYQRVRVHSTSTVAIAGYAAEGVMHALAELMDNAASFSPPSEQVHVYVEEVQAGVVVTIEDSGLVMSDLALRRAEQAVSAEELDLTTLSGTRLGLAVVGCLARKHGLTVSFRPSSRGGTGVVVMIPRRLITEPRREPGLGRPISGGSLTPPTGIDPGAADRAGQAGAAGRSAATVGSAGSVQSVGAGGAGPVEVPAAAGTGQGDGLGGALGDDGLGDGLGGGAGDGLGDLPKRRRGQTLAASVPPAAPKAAPSRPSSDTGARFAAFRRAGRGAGATGPAETSGPANTATADTGPAGSPPAADGHRTGDPTGGAPRAPGEDGRA